MFNCIKCNKIFKFESHYKRHINSIKSCVKIIDNDGEFVCQYCNKKFKHRANIYRHQKNSCEKIPTNNTINNITNNTTNNTNNITNNTNNITNNTNIINNNINITVSFDSVDIKSIYTDEQLYKLFCEKTYDAIKIMIKDIFCNINKPENLNVYVPSLTHNFINLFNCFGCWEAENKDKIIDSLIIKCSDIISDAVCDMIEKKNISLSKGKQQCLDYYSTEADDNTSKNYKQFFNDINLLFFNNKNLIKSLK
jgi:uncharacterized C2H2 Zn-finger protein